MNFESLANEILLDLFELIDGVHLLRAFHNLNSRFDSLLFTHFRAYSFDFRSVSKTDFNNVCQQYLPSIVDRTVSLCLSDGNETWQQTAYFFSHDFNLRQFEYLQSLSLYDIHHAPTMDTIMDGIHYFSLLIHLNVVNCYFWPKYFDDIWCLPELTRFHLHRGHMDYRYRSVALTKTSLSLQDVAILGRIEEAAFLEHLLKSTPSLRRLSLDLNYDYRSQDQSFILPLLEISKFSLKYSISPLENLTKHMPNLTQLTIETPNIYVDGYQWESFIIDYLPKLKIFRLMMQFRFDGGINSEEQANEILDSFRTPFWIDEHQWFVRCHWNQELGSKFYSLYTLPFTLTKFCVKPNLQFKSTSPREDDYYSYDCVRYLSYDFGLCTKLLRINFPNIDQLHLRFPINDIFWSFIPTCHRLTSLSVTNYNDDTDSSQLQLILNRAPHIYSLQLESKLSISHCLPMKITNALIRRVDLRHYYFNEKTCDAWCRSSLAMQCQVLSIDVQNGAIILYLINNMKNLRELKIRRKGITLKTIDISDPLSQTNEELIACLQQHLPSTYTTLRRKTL